MPRFGVASTLDLRDSLAAIHLEVGLLTLTLTLTLPLTLTLTLTLTRTLTLALTRSAGRVPRFLRHGPLRAHAFPRPARRTEPSPSPSPSP